ncbi:MAG TPA: PepSY-associated TM helix domain-containing protein [Moraxellaceae bacterium]
MKEGFRQSMAWLHTWSGLLVGWVLLAIFVTGTASYFRSEITLWMQPELQAARTVGSDGGDVVALAQQKLQAQAPQARTWFIEPPDGRDPSLQIAWRAAGKKGAFERETLDAASGDTLQARDTRGGEFFYRFHFQLSLPPLWGRWIVGICAMSMLVAIISGVITHRRIFKDFFTFRPKKGQRSWLDAHNASGVLALPFHLMITYTGLVTLMYLYQPWGITTAYQGDRETYFNEVAEKSTPTEASGRPAALTPLSPLVAQALKSWEGGRIGRITVDYPNDANATVRIARHDGDRISTHGDEIIFNGITGQEISRSTEAGGAKLLHGTFYGLHIARFAEPLLRWLFFLAGLTGCAMVATGLLLWSVARTAQLRKSAQPGIGLRLVNQLNIAAVAGLPLAIAVFFWANRLLPFDLPERADFEVKLFFVAWLLVPFYAGLRSPQQAWKEVTGAAAALLFLLPLLNALTTDTHLGVTLLAGQWARASFDLVLLALGGVLGFTAWKLGHWQPVARQKPVVPKEAAAGSNAAAAGNSMETTVLQEEAL